jgi:hypothetical protein
MKYRRKLPLGAADAAQAGYQKWIDVYKGTGTDTATKVHLADKCESFPDDILFKDSVGTSLSFARDPEYGDSTYQRFWIRLDVATSAMDYYIYYGDAEATDVSDPDDTFEFADYFPGTSLDGDKWENNNLTSSVSGGKLRVTGHPGDWPSNSGQGAYQLTAKWTIPTNVIIEYSMSIYHPGGSGSSHGMGLAGMVIHDSNEKCLVASMADDGHGSASHLTYGSPYSYVWAGSTKSDTGHEFFAYTTSKSAAWYPGIYRITKVGNDYTIELVSESFKPINGVTASGADKLGFQFSKYGSYPQFTEDVFWVIARKYIADEPAWGTFGSEEEIGAASSWGGIWGG